MTAMDCTTCRSQLPDLLLEGGDLSSPVRAHLAGCSPCEHEWKELRETWLLMDEWVAPEPSPYFDTRLHARLRTAQAEQPEGVWERLLNHFRFNTGREVRPALAGALALILLLGGGTAATLLTRHPAGPVASPTVNDLRIYDNNAQALQQMDILDDTTAQSGGQS